MGQVLIIVLVSRVTLTLSVPSDTLSGSYDVPTLKGYNSRTEPI